MAGCRLKPSVCVRACVIALCQSSLSERSLKMFQIKVWRTGCYCTCTHTVPPDMLRLVAEIFDSSRASSLNALQ